MLCISNLFTDDDVMMLLFVVGVVFWRTQTLTTCSRTLSQQALTEVQREKGWQAKSKEQVAHARTHSKHGDQAVFYKLSVVIIEVIRVTLSYQQEEFCNMYNSAFDRYYVTMEMVQGWGQAKLLLRLYWVTPEHDAVSFRVCLWL